MPKTRTITLTELASYYNEYLFDRDHAPGRPMAKHFVIGTNGKVTYWFIEPTQNGYYKCYPHDEAGNLLQPRYFDPCKTKVTIHYLEPYWDSTVVDDQLAELKGDRSEE